MTTGAAAARPGEDPEEPADRLARFRAGFPGARQRIYLDVAARGLISERVREAIIAHVDERMMLGGDKAGMFASIESARTAFAALIGAEPDEIALTRNVSDGLNAAAAAIDWRSGDEVVLCPALEHPANILPWLNLARRKGVRVREILPDGDRLPVARMAEALGPRTRAVAISSVTFAPGFATPLSELGAACRSAGVHLIVDGAQSAGTVQTDVNAERIDILAASSQKGLLSLYGLGFLYIRRALAEDLQPLYLSRMGVELDSAHEASSGGIERYRLALGARRFDLGNHNYVAARAALCAMNELDSVGMATIASELRGLAVHLAGGLTELGLPVFGAPENPDRRHIVSLGDSLADEHDSTHSEAMADLSRHLFAANVQHSIRRGVIRLSLHAYNDIADMDAVIDIARDWVVARG